MMKINWANGYEFEYDVRKVIYQNLEKRETKKHWKLKLKALDSFGVGGLCTRFFRQRLCVIFQNCNQLEHSTAIIVEMSSFIFMYFSIFKIFVHHEYFTQINCFVEITPLKRHKFVESVDNNFKILI